MEEKQDCVVAAGGDLRQVYAANSLARVGAAVTALGFADTAPFESVAVSGELSALAQADLVLFPLTMTKGKVLNTPFYEGKISFEDCLRQIPQGCLVYGGNVTEEERQLAEHYGIQIQDYFKVEELTVANAVLTAEAAIQLAMEQLPISLWKSRVLLFGGGRISRALLPRLLAFGAQVTVVARRPEQRIWAEAEGAKAVGLTNLSPLLPEQQLIINTIPQKVLGEKELRAVSSDCLLLELASKPYGIDFDAAQKMGLRAVLASGLPGKHCPKTAGEWIANTVLTMRRG